jgi:hypothetical protein
MGDGSKLNTGIILNTQSFTIKECVQIISILIYKYNLVCNIYMQRNLPTIYISGKSMRKIQKNLLPYIIPSMRYKFHI